MNRLIYLLFLLLIVFANSLSAQETSTISGTVSGLQDGEAVISASVYILTDTSTKPLKGAYTNKFGLFSIPKVSAGKYILVVSSLSYSQYRQEIIVSVGTDLKLKISLSPKDIMLDEVVVEGGKDLPATQRIGTFNVAPSFINKMPAILGEIDVFRSLQLMPGIQTASEISSGLYVRGGSPDQNLNLLDGVIVYNPAHLGGFFSVFNTDALKDIKLIKGCFPAEYGGRLSSVLDMSMKEGNKEKLTGDAMISLIASKLTIEGPITEDASFMISGRRMYFDVLMWLFMDSEQFKDSPTYYFYDLNAKINYKLFDNDHLFVSGFFARDVLNAPEEYEQNFGIHWGNATANLRWMHIISPTIFTNFSLIYTDYNFNTQIEIDTNLAENFYSLSKIQDITFRGEAQIFPAENHIIKTGIEITNHNFDAGANTTYNDYTDEVDFLGTTHLAALEAAIYAQDDWSITDKLSSNLGARIFYFNKGSYFAAEPRLSLAYKLNDATSLKTAFAIANQYLHLIVRNDISLPTDLWFPSTENIKPSRAYQAMIGFENYFDNKKYYWTIEVYYKKMTNLYEYNDSASFSLGLPLESQFTNGTGDAYGIEVFLNKQIGNLSGWIGYTLAWTNRLFPELNSGKAFPPRYDRRHDISITANYKFNDKWEIAASWIYGTGQAYTMPTGMYSFNDNPYYNGEWDEERTAYSDRNGVRLPAYHRLDANVMYHTTFFGLPSVLSINVYNVYNHKNPFVWYIAESFVPEGAVSGHYEKKLKQVTLFPIVPTIAYSVHF